MFSGKNKAFIAALSIVTAVNIIFMFFPLLSDFSYEFSVGNAVLFFLVLPYYFRKLLSDFPPDTPVCFAKKHAAEFLAILLSPLAVLFFSGNMFACSVIHGIEYYLLIPAVTFINVFLLTYTFYRYKLKRFIFIHTGILFLLVSVPIWEIYNYPQIYFYNVVIGFFPGTVYDKYIPADLKLISYRFFTLGVFFGLTFLRSKPFPFVKAAGILTVSLLLLKPFFGFDTTFEKLNDAAKAEHVNENFDIFFFFDADSTERKYYALLHEYYKFKTETFLADKFDFRINSYIFADSEQKRKFFGAPDADVTKPWQYSIFVTENSGTLEHELAHAFSVKYGTGILKLARNLNPALIEGFAVAVENKFYGRDLFEVAAALYRENVKIDVARLFDSYSFFKNAPSLSYLYAGAFVKFLIKTYGIEKFKKYYATDDFERSYGVSPNKSANDFYSFLNNYETKTEDRALIKYILENKALFQLKCPHYVAEQEHYAKKQRSKAKEIYMNLFLSYDAPADFFNLLDLLFKERNFREAEKLLTQFSSEFRNSAYYSKYLNYLLYAKFAVGNLSNADSLVSLMRRNSPFLYYEVKADFYAFCLVHKNFSERYFGANDSARVFIVKNFFRDDFSSSLFVSNLNIFSDDEIKEIAGKNIDKLNWYAKYFVALRFLRKLKVNDAERFVETLSDFPARYERRIRELKNKTDFFRARTEN